jgi:ribonuclease BN (tRNA processing enzyme)
MNERAIKLAKNSDLLIVNLHLLNQNRGSESHKHRTASKPHNRKKSKSRALIPHTSPQDTKPSQKLSKRKQKRFSKIQKL